MIAMGENGSDKHLSRESLNKSRGGLRCPSCQCVQFRVYRTQQKTGFVLRTRVCRHCGATFQTREEYYRTTK